MDYIEPIAAVIAGVWAGRLWIKLRSTRAQLTIETEKKDEAANEYLNAYRALNHLRANAFITNAKGHRVRYVNATSAERARAEGAE